MFSEKSNSFEKLAKLQAENEDALLVKENVVGTALGHRITGGKDTGDECVIVYVKKKQDLADLKKAAQIPKTFGKFKSDVVEVGEVYAQTLVTQTERRRPYAAGLSVGHKNITAGSIGALATLTGDVVPNRYFILSNCHVLADSGAGLVGDDVYQPGPFDGGLGVANRIAKLTKFVPIVFSNAADNRVDCAIAEIDRFADFDNDIHALGLRGTASVAVGDLIQKSGRTTGFTRGKVTGVNASIVVNFGPSGLARFNKQTVTTPISEGGDSGSLVIDTNDRAVGLLFAGSAAATFINPIGAVLTALGIDLL